MEPPPPPDRLDYRSGSDTLADEAAAMHRSVRTWLVLSVVWVEGSATQTRLILVVSGLIFLGLTALVASWARRIRDQFAPQDDLVETPGADVDA